MRFLLTIFATLLLSITVAQELPNVTVGVIQDGGEMRLLSAPQSTIVVDIQLSTLRFTAGEHARYAQKYLGERAVMSDRVSIAIESAVITLAPVDFHVTKPLSTPFEVESSRDASAHGLPVERSSAEILSSEQRAQASAQRIFANRRLARDLISGDVGEGVFGAGLTSVLERLDREERECLAQFMGEQTTTLYSRRVTINPRGNATRYMIGRFTPESGLTSPNDIEGEAVYLQITPSIMQDSTYNLAVGKEPKHRVFVSPNYSQCDLYVGANIVSSVELPLYEYGSRTTIIYDKK